MNTDGNTYAINRHLAEREEYDLHQSMVDDIEALRDEVNKLEAQRDELLGALRAAAEELDDYSPLTGNTIETSASRAARAAIAKAKENT